MMRLSLFVVTLFVVLIAVIGAQDKTATPFGPLLNRAVAEKITFFEVNVDGPYIAMTFDDGLHATNTANLLDMAIQRYIKLTFFVLGQCVQENLGTLQREVAEEHEIHNHLWSYPNFAKLSDEAVCSQLR